MRSDELKGSAGLRGKKRRPVSKAAEKPPLPSDQSALEDEFPPMTLANMREEETMRLRLRSITLLVLTIGYKAFLVGVNREACAKYKRALDKLLPPEWSEAIYTENAADLLDRPLVAEIQISDEREADARLLFKKASENPKILIVTDKLLTGYDAPVLYCMYLDKPMRDHVLLQAIARVNRPYVDAEGIQKRVGLVIDFVGVLRELRKALKFDSSDISGVIEDLDLLLKDLLNKIAKAKTDYLEADGTGSADERLEKMVYGRFLDQEPRKAFFEAYKDIEALWEILSPPFGLLSRSGQAPCFRMFLRAVPLPRAQPTGAGPTSTSSSHCPRTPRTP
jgi:type I restriction enzyme, R subunit